MRRLWSLGIVLLLASVAFGGEQIDLTTPDQASAGTPSYYVSRLDLDWDGARVTVYLNSAAGFKKTLVFTGADAITYMKAVNKRDFTMTSMQKWTSNQLIGRGWLSGTISGSPD